MAKARFLEAKGVTITEMYPVVGGSTFKAGDILTITSAGLATQTLTAGNNMGAVSNNELRILGQAMEDALRADGSEKTQVSVRLAVPGAWFKLWLYHGTAASAYANTNMLSTAYELRYDTATTGFAVAVDATTNTKCRIVAFGTETFSVSAKGRWPEGIQPSTEITGAADTTVSSNQYPEVWVEFTAGASLFGAR